MTRHQSRMESNISDSDAMRIAGRIDCAKMSKCELSNKRIRAASL
jgi:hypothetical protein